MNNLLIPNIAQLKLAEISALSTTIDQVQNDVAARQSTIDSLIARNALFSDRLAQADAIRDTALANLNITQASMTATDALATASEEVNRQASETDAALSKIAEKKVELVRQLAFVASLLEKAGHLINKQKASNPVIPDTLISVLSQAGSDCANVLALGLTAQDACMVASSTMNGTHSSLELAQKQVATLKGMLATDGGPAGEHGGVFGNMKGIYSSGMEHYDAALAVNTNATNQINHASATLATAKAKLASLQMGLAAMGDGKTKGDGKK